MDNGTFILNTQIDNILSLVSEHGSGVAALYLYLAAGKNIENAARDLNLSEDDVSVAHHLLLEASLCDPHRTTDIFTDNCVKKEVIELKQNSDRSFSLYIKYLQDEILRRPLRHPGETGIAFVLYYEIKPKLGSEMLLRNLTQFCAIRSRRQVMCKIGYAVPTMSEIEAEGRKWIDIGISSIMQASEYISRYEKLLNDRDFILDVIPQWRYKKGIASFLFQWLDEGFERDAIFTAYTISCMNNANGRFSYVQQVLNTMAEKNLMTAAQIQEDPYYRTYYSDSLGEV